MMNVTFDEVLEKLWRFPWLTNVGWSSHCQRRQRSRRGTAMSI